MRRLRAAALSEVELAMDIINQAKAHLRAQGIDQWQTGYPDRDCLERDVRTGKGYFLEEDGIPLGYLCVDFDGEPAYDHLNGTWAREEPYVVVHRLALSDAARGRGAAGTAFQLVEDLWREGLLDYVAVDVKALPEDYPAVCGREGFAAAGDTLARLAALGAAREARTTLYPGFSLEQLERLLETAVRAGSRADLDEVVGGAQDTCVVVDDDDGVPVSNKLTNDR